MIGCSVVDAAICSKTTCQSSVFRRPPPPPPVERKFRPPLVSELLSPSLFAGVAADSILSAPFSELPCLTSPLF
jgi:hypothetical protein